MATDYGSTGFASGTNDVKARAANLGSKAADSVDRARGSAADQLSSAADAVENGADAGATRAKRAAQATANALSSGADYLRENSARDMLDDAVDVVRNNPGVALLGAVALGFIVGRAFTSRS